mgnify:CR=1 FL=1
MSDVSLSDVSFKGGDATQSALQNRSRQPSISHALEAAGKWAISTESVLTGWGDATMSLWERLCHRQGQMEAREAQAREAEARLHLLDQEVGRRKILEAIEQARIDLAVARAYFDQVDDPEQIDHAVAMLTSAERKLVYLTRKAQQEGVYAPEFHLTAPSFHSTAPTRQLKG